jgi:hypothetical protein
MPRIAEKHVVRCRYTRQLDRLRGSNNKGIGSRRATRGFLLTNGHARPISVIMPGNDVALSRPTPWREVLILCRKCGKKLDGGFGTKRKESLKDVLRQALRDSGRRRQVRIMETSCLGICPKRGVTTLNASHPGTIHVIPRGSDGAEAMRRLLGDRRVVDADGVEGA